MNLDNILPLRFMTSEMSEADRYYREKNKLGILLGATVRAYLPAHGDLGCWCNACTLYGISQGKQHIIRIKIPYVKEVLAKAAIDKTPDETSDEMPNDTPNETLNERPDKIPSITINEVNNCDDR